jgi:cell division protein FtsB
MKLCSSGHDEICFEGRSCPACDLMEQVSKLEDDISEARVDIMFLSAKTLELESEVEKLKEPFRAAVAVVRGE